ncbi:MAG TPA: nucleotide exchange factor GrpE [Mycobacteriales bacterium]|nr:nucleotide exchange factor GrpE [Mycobacteriales bacterium]
MSERGDKQVYEEPQRVVIRDKRRIDPATGELRAPEAEQVWTVPAGGEPRGTALAGDAAVWRAGQAPTEGEDTTVAELTAQLAERTGDLQRITAEYANYRKRVDRDRSLVAEAATAGVLATLLPVLDDLDRARDHGDLTGAFKAVADQLVGALGKLGLTPFGEPGDPFDPTVHEAVSHSTSPEVSRSTCVGIMRHGYTQGERLLRPALVAVADPEEPTVSESTVPGPPTAGDGES